MPFLAAICLLIFLTVPYLRKQQALRALAVRTQTIVEMTAYSLSPALYFNDADTIKEVFLSARQNRDLVYIFVVDPAGTVVSEFNKTLADRVNFTAEESGVSADGSIFKAKSRVFYKERQLGNLYIGLSLEALSREMRLMKKNLFLLSLFIFCLGALTVFLLTTVITTPLRRMTKTAMRITEGDLAERAEVSSRDEVGLLARSFNSMIDNLQLSYCQLENAKHSLEKRVEERTAELKLTVSRLEERNSELALLSEMGDSFQMCNEEKEIYAICEQFVRKLFSNAAGNLYVLKESKNLLEAVVTWGDINPRRDFMEPGECWALRRGKPYIVENAASELLCPHVKSLGGEPLPYLCVPLMAHGETIGLLHLQCLQEHASETQSLPEIGNRLNFEMTQPLAQDFASRVAMALANLRLRETLRQQSVRDPMTGLFNRRYMEETLVREIYKAERSFSSLGILMLDIDFFKQFNEAYGHEAGDIMLQALGQFLQNNIRKGDIACRYGGEEFTLILPGASLSVARERAECLLKEVRNLNVLYGNRLLGPISLSFGISLFPEHGNKSADLLKAADTALFQAKKTGRNRCVAYGD
jgi:diguanylate cyclase (GGDEF)-like protein